ncbi:MAG: thioredoxin-dependent thiol peroxidase [Bacteroidales bacterium]|nr:thioredoxin-dependent thiol peroxidase [Bacteroidales bacterium]
MTHLKIGDPSPDFSGIDQNGNTISLHDFHGKKLILYFYPKDNTPGCSAEACSLRDADSVLAEHGYNIVGVSKDSAASHQKFIEKFVLTFPLIADVEHQIMESYGVWGEKKMMGKTFMGTLRTTFIINEKGLIEHIIETVNTKEHGSQILKLLQIQE